MLLLDLAAGALGVLSHVLYFNNGEHHMWAVKYVQLFVTAFIGTATALVKGWTFNVSSAISTTAILAASYLIGVFTSMFVYRIFFHPLKKFPGPFGAKVLGLWMSFHASSLDGYLRYEDLHKKYGKYVRTGPNTLSISDSDVLEAAFGPKPWRKAEW